MWCANCHADVAAEASADNRTLRCATCRTTLMTAHHASSADSTEQARELLRRWSSEEMLDPFGPLPQRTRSPSLADSPAATVARETNPENVKFRIDRPHQNVPNRTGGDPGTDSATRSGDTPSPQTQPTAWTRVHAPHGAADSSPHFDVQTAIAESLNQPTNWASFFGHLLAYGGVLAMTVGASCVVWGYFGGPATYAPTGWLLTTAGQMLLFLGMVTLVAGGMEQTTHEVARRIDTLGEKIVRIEQASRDHALRGPNFSPQDLGGERVARGRVEQKPNE